MLNSGRKRKEKNEAEGSRNTSLAAGYNEFKD